MVLEAKKETGAESSPKFLFALTPELESLGWGNLDFSPDDFLPTRAEPFATGWDVRCAEPKGFDLKPFYYYKIPLGFKAIPEKGWWAELNTRSSLFAKRHIHALYGKVDEMYSEQWFFACQFIPGEEILTNGNHNRIEFGDRVGQIIPVKRQEMIVQRVSNFEFESILGFTNRKRSGFGSTGEK